ncbi:hypothetical protein ACQ3HE_06765 [Plantibacter auratus]|uniref:hypothetical protein n=1 Tax=Plantibacter auratus TaxID=272914 RepID=UPI003D347A2B
MSDRERLIHILDENDPEGGVTDPEERYDFWEPQAEAILKSEWLARHDAKVAAKALESAAQRLHLAGMREKRLNRKRAYGRGVQDAARTVRSYAAMERLGRKTT